MTGIGSVAVSPEQRRRGIGEALVRATLREMRQQGERVLDPVRVPRLVLPQSSDGARSRSRTRSRSRRRTCRRPRRRAARARLMLPDRPAVQELYARVAPQGHFALERRPEWWAQRLWTYPGDWVVYEGRRRGQIDGYLYYEVRHDERSVQAGAHAERARCRDARRASRARRPSRLARRSGAGDPLRRARRRGVARSLLKTRRTCAPGPRWA